MRIYYNASGKRRGYSMGAGEAFGTWFVKAVVVFTFLSWPLAAASSTHGRIAPWGWFAEVSWLLLLTAIVVVVVATRGDKS